MVAVPTWALGFWMSSQVWKGFWVLPSANSQTRLGAAMPGTVVPSKLTYIARSAKTAWSASIRVEKGTLGMTWLAKRLKRELGPTTTLRTTFIVRLAKVWSWKVKVTL